jgi:glycosyltransferase involved in cell wall biosynthesis
MRLDIVIPVYHEGPNIVSVLELFRHELRFPYRVLICYDFDGDSTLAILEQLSKEDYHFELVKNHGRGVLDAIRAGLRQTTASFLLTFPADDNYNAPRINGMLEKAQSGYDIVSGSRFVPSGCMEDCPSLEAILGTFLISVASKPDLSTE